MLRTLALTPWDSFTPALLRSEPAALGAWIRYRFVQWLLATPLIPSGWTYGGASHALVVGGAGQAQIELRNGNDAIELAYRFSEIGVAIGSPIPHTLTQTLPSIKGESAVWLNTHAGDGGSVKTIDDLAKTRDALAVDLSALTDAQVTRSGMGIAGAAMLLGVRPQLRADLSKIAMYTRKLTRLASQPSRRARYTPGILRTDWAPVDRVDGANEGGVNADAIKEAVDLILSQHAFRGIAFFPALQGKNANGDVSVYFGEVTNTTVDEKGAVPHVDKQTVSKLIDLGIEEFGKSPKQIKADLLAKLEDQVTKNGATWLKENPASTLVATAIAVASSGKIRDYVKGHTFDLMKIGLGAYGEDLGLSAGLNDFLMKHAEAITKGQWQPLAEGALAQGLGGGALGDRAAAVIMEKMTGKPVTTLELSKLGAQGLKKIIEDPTVASGESGSAAVTDTGTDAETGEDTVTVQDGAGSKTMTFQSFVGTFTNIATLGIFS